MADDSISNVHVAQHRDDAPIVAHLAADKDVPEKSLEEDELLSLKSKQQFPRFPSNLRRIGRERDYIAPGAVAIGPYYHGVPELQQMEEFKRTVANYFFQEGLAQLREATYEKIKSIALNVRCCYTDKDALQGITDDKFAEIMFIDGCFLVQCIVNTVRSGSGDDALRSIIHPHYVEVFRDMMLLENQIPWEVMEVLMPLKSLEMEQIISFLVMGIHGVSTAENFAVGISNKDYKPQHLLCLIWFFEAAASKSAQRPYRPFSQQLVPLSTSAVELAEIGIKLEASQKMQFSAMDIMKGPCSAKLVLAPLLIDAVLCCFLVNMAAFEMCAETFLDDCSVNSYLRMLSQLVNREEDVRELRVNRIFNGGSSDQEILKFFNDLAPTLSQGKVYWLLLADLEEYKQKRWMWISIYRFFYKHAKIIATVLPIVGVLVGIFKAILSLKQPPAHH